MASTCDIGKLFNVNHALSSARGGLSTIQHIEIRDITATFLTEVCHDVCLEPDFQPVTPYQLSGAFANRQYGARLDVSANGVWGGRFEKTYFDVVVVNPLIQATETRSKLLCIGCMSKRRNLHMNSEYTVK